ncbi:GNAT family N-acetyltransferase [Aurantimonas sp. VKM B-3413]|uniref:GNAT family N-acetyltransferase n=1 Tax=Aurantimonas sp. VKM B-3413 TaxID=2779401 RepID=UPI001E32E3C8|nr:GNAT family N-acetyltransferase [Aurantimonas sp. VKM B-3413]MCB8840773.1 GNAT family N-acetyltransferase [Aurantimonas sp. VKM B-3413]
MNGMDKRPLHFEIITDADALAAAGPAWDGLWRETNGLIFQSHAWISAWWRTLQDRDRRTLQVVLAWEGNHLRALLPMATCRRHGLRVLEWAAKDHSDYGDALVAPGVDPAILLDMARHLSKSTRFDIAYVNRLLPNAAARIFLAGADSAPFGLRPNRRFEQSFRITGDWATGADWLKSQSKKFRKTYRHSRNTLEGTGQLRSRMLAADEPRADVLAQMAEFKRAWLTRHDLSSNDLFDPESQTLSALIEVLAEAGILHFFVLELDGTAIAMSVNFVQQGTMMAFVTTYDPEFERGSPGMVLMLDYIQWAFDAGLSTVDFLCGSEGFKQRYANTDVTLASAMGAGTLAGMAAVFADETTWRIGRLRERLAARRSAADIKREEAAVGV